MSEVKKPPSPKGTNLAAIVAIVIVSLIVGIAGGYLLYNLLTDSAGDTVESEEPPAVPQRPKPAPQALPERQQAAPRPDPRSGVVIGFPNIELRDIDTKNASGPVVVRVAPGSLEERRGIERGDAITKVEDIPVRDVAEVNEVMTKFQSRDWVRLQIKRGGQDVLVPVEVQR